jgi:hypothetical protein
MSNSKLGALLAVPLITILVLSGCVQGGNQTPSPDVSSPPSTRAPVDPTAPPVEIKTGDTVTAEEAENLAKNQVAWRAPGGSLVVVTAGEPVPEALASALGGEGASLLAAGQAGSNNAGQRSAFTNSLKELTATGVDTVVIGTGYGTIGGDNSEGRYVFYYVLADGQRLSSSTYSEAEAIATAEAWVAANPGATIVKGY